MTDDYFIDHLFGNLIQYANNYSLFLSPYDAYIKQERFLEDPTTLLYTFFYAFYFRMFWDHFLMKPRSHIGYFQNINI